MKKLLEYTDDGLPTLYLPELDEHYHSIKGAFTEALHVYIESALKYSKANPVHILEIGFGTGLNAFLSALEAEKSTRTIYYTTTELYPLEWSEIEPLQYPQMISSGHIELFHQLHLSPWEKEIRLSPNFTFLKTKTDISFHIPEGYYHVIYYDAFAPEKQPQLWEENIFTRIASMTSKGGILTTYCAKGEVRRRLQRAGFEVERLPGPPKGKREILRGTKL
ncbi:tRNA (5-methylaminomethyl-2-thiouridine)(34)-methyltransferase MnmD [Coprobacter tertius]|uniref:tRNA (5-methylaminomethyl-2-thiouridine)(34)-methyltransferase MnmD n=1 Tax=Coprobacter tertius TaxID=2944915 RepID=A0ABT1MCY9_9BACT|nr:tRNA (5-methylaminomethyl-2-thiouridine)(34)-methyltransferase MnmD [Coprobacter tertius]MCP9610504.1 tRNA (5-methylaminomethyl-2-thiouridine)(34)-methyltransferase MnmD [Coprobacter tertius]